MLFGEGHENFTGPEYLTTTLSGNPPRHVAPAPTHTPARRELGLVDQVKTGRGSESLHPRKKR
jgi:hypothetical protein